MYKRQVVACGCTVAFAVSAANALEKEGIGVRVLDMHTVRPCLLYTSLGTCRRFGKAEIQLFCHFEVIL